jgi:succinoglycan biosynthesis transport protein ExoP
VVDGHYVAPHVEVIVLVARWAATSQAVARKSVNNLMGIKRPDMPIVCVLNRQDETKTSYYRTYGDYYSYTT